MHAMIDRKSSRYSAPENESCQPGSNDTVLANKLGIISAQEMENKESNCENYFSAVRQGLDCNYDPVTKVFTQVIKCSF